MSQHLNLSLASIANHLKDQLFGRNPFNDKNQNSFAFFFEVSADYYGYAEDGNTKIHDESSRRVGGMILYTGNTMCWGISDPEFTVGAAYQIKTNRNIKNLFKKAEFLSSHDTCWRNAVDNYFRKLEKSLLDSVVAHVPESEREEARKRASLFVWNMGDMFAHVKCDYERREVKYYRTTESHWFPTSITFDLDNECKVC